MNILGKLVCYLTKRHKWDRGRLVLPNIPGDGDPYAKVLIKRCRLCGLIRAVKTRKEKGAA
jgi:hypothetical protein